MQDVQFQEIHFTIANIMIHYHLVEHKQIIHYNGMGNL
jgi:hypothetical protein